jgi:hypothetical protein
MRILFLSLNLKEMSLAKIVKWESITDQDLKELKKCVKNETSRRKKELESARQDKEQNILLKIWPNLVESGEFVPWFDERTLGFTINPKIRLNINPCDPIQGEADEPPYRVRLEKRTTSNKEEKYSLHIDLNSGNGCGTTTSYLVFNFGALGNERMGQHWQFNNYRELPKAFLHIPVIFDMFNSPKKVFDEYIKHRQ